MKFLLIFIIFACCGINSLLADESNSGNSVARNIANEFDNLYSSIDCRKTDDNFYSRACKLNEKTSKSLILWHLTEEKMQTYLADFIGRMDKMATSTGRKVMHESYDYGNGSVMQEWWLERGELDDEKCQWDFDKRQACFYPEGFIEFRIEFFESDTSSYNDEVITMQSIRVQIDSPQENVTNIIDVSLSASYSDANNNSAIFDVSGNEYKYDEYYKWKNQVAQDIHDGMMVKVSQKQRRIQAKQLKGTGILPIEWEGDDSRQWPSQKLPGRVVFAQTFDASVYTRK